MHILHIGDSFGWCAREGFTPKTLSTLWPSIFPEVALHDLCSKAQTHGSFDVLQNRLLECGFRDWLLEDLQMFALETLSFLSVSLSVSVCRRFVSALCLCTSIIIARAMALSTL